MLLFFGVAQERNARKMEVDLERVSAQLRTTHVSPPSSGNGSAEVIMESM